MLNYFQEEYYKKLYEKEKDDHSVTISKLSEAETEIERLRDQLSKLTKDMEEKLQQAQLEVSSCIFHTQKSSSVEPIICVHCSTFFFACLDRAKVWKASGAILLYYSI